MRRTTSSLSGFPILMTTKEQPLEVLGRFTIITSQLHDGHRASMKRMISKQFSRGFVSQSYRFIISITWWSLESVTILVKP
ncbi:hypothetical protein LINPERHAP2_LOCUS14625 [Linum perenne]